MGGETWEINELSEVTILFGKNGSGKSKILRAWRDGYESVAHYVSPERTGEMDFQPQYMREETPSGRRSASSGNYAPEYRRRVVNRIQSYLVARGNHRGTGAIPASPTEIESLINTLVTDFSIELMGSGETPYKLVRNDGGLQITGVESLSSGEAQLITMALDMLTIAAIWEILGQEKRVLLIDEPDAHIHPDLQTRFADFVFRVMDRFNLQIAIATHSTALLTALGQFGGARTGTVYVRREVLRYQARRFDSVHRELSACLGGHVLMGSLFGAPILLVEGDDDYRIWSQVPRHHIVNFAVVPSNGDEIKHYQRALERIFSSLMDQKEKPFGYALIDADKPLPLDDEHTPQKYVRFVRTICHEAENLYLSDEVLKEIGIDWANASELIVAKAGEFGEKGPILAQAKNWDRKSADIKKVIGEIAGILDKKPIHWTVRVGKVLGRSRPIGQLAEYLGTSVLNALWPDVA